MSNPWNNYNALIVKTDTSHGGHGWVVMEVQHKKCDDGISELIKTFKFIYARHHLHPLNCQFVNLCSDYKANLGALICDDEYNPIHVGKIE